MNTPYTAGIHLPHLSASTVNKFIEDRYGFYAAKVKMVPFKGSVNTCLGKAVEHGLNQWIEENPDTDYLKAAYECYDAELKEAGITKIIGAELRGAIKGLLEVALKTYKNQFPVVKPKTQVKGSFKLPGVEREFLMYIDYYIPGEGIWDCKTASKSSSTLSQGYILQGSLYRAKYNVPVTFDYFVNNKTPVHKQLVLSNEEYTHGISYLTRAAQTIEQLQVEQDPKEVMRLMSFPNLDNLWTMADKKAAAKDWDIWMP
jgi:hypothetical protein